MLDASLQLVYNDFNNACCVVFGGIKYMKWYQKPVAILIVLLVLFPALGMSSCNTSAVITSSVTTPKTTTMQTESTTESYQVEINKGIKLAKYVTPK